jgi:hypothetical protein
MLGWAGVSPQARVIILLVLAASVLAAVDLLVAIAAASRPEPDEPDRSPQSPSREDPDRIE